MPYQYKYQQLTFRNQKCSSLKHTKRENLSHLIIQCEPYGCNF